MKNPAMHIKVVIFTGQIHIMKIYVIELYYLLLLYDRIVLCTVLLYYTLFIPIYIRIINVSL